LRRQRLKRKCIILHGRALYLQAAEEFLWLKEKRYSCTFLMRQAPGEIRSRERPS
jgi:hypothetical protein